jgi:hypothetical protein
VTVDALGIGRGWPSIDLPGYREHPEEFATYSTLADNELPPIERQLDDELSWLLSESPVEHSLAGGHIYEGDPVRPATGAELDSLTNELGLRLPRAFDTFIRTLEPRARVRSCTACYLDLGDFPVAVGTEGRLIHFLSDQQWVGHWLLYVGHDGSEGVVAGYPPYGFALGASLEDEYGRDFDPARFEQGTGEAVVCADSFSEFLYRFWIENEIWHALADESARELTPEQRRYAEHYVEGQAS